MKRLDEIFNICYGSQLDLNKCEICGKNQGFNFVNRSNSNCGVSARIQKIDKKEPFKAGSITVAMGGSVLSSFVQQEDFYTGQNVKVLVPIEEMGLAEKLFYCQCIEANRFRFSTFGREANYTFDSLLVPAREEVPQNVKTKCIGTPFESKPIARKAIELNMSKWHWFRYDEVFEICKGFYNKKPDENPLGNIPFIGATDSNNGITSFHDLETIEESSKTGSEPNASLDEKIFKEGCITVSNNGSVGYAFYQNKKFTCTHDVNPLYLNGRWDVNLNVYTAMFLCTIIEKEQFRWDYGRKWRPKRMPASLIKLPAIDTGNKDKSGKTIYEPDWQFMEDYIKSLPYSACL